MLRIVLLVLAGLTMDLIAADYYSSQEAVAPEFLPPYDEEAVFSYKEKERRGSFWEATVRPASEDLEAEDDWTWLFPKTILSFATGCFPCAKREKKATPLDELRLVVVQYRLSKADGSPLANILNTVLTQTAYEIAALDSDASSKKISKHAKDFFKKLSSSLAKDVLFVEKRKMFNHAAIWNHRGWLSHIINASVFNLIQQMHRSDDDKAVLAAKASITRIWKAVHLSGFNLHDSNGLMAKQDDLFNTVLREWVTQPSERASHKEVLVEDFFKKRFIIENLDFVYAMWDILAQTGEVRKRRILSAHQKFFPAETIAESITFNSTFKASMATMAQEIADGNTSLNAWLEKAAEQYENIIFESRNWVEEINRIKKGIKPIDSESSEHLGKLIVNKFLTKMPGHNLSKRFSKIVFETSALANTVGGDE